MGIDWDKITEDERKIIRKIVERARVEHPEIDGLTLELDITVVHVYKPLRLQELLMADDSDFWHDLMGIAQHVDRKTGEIGDNFSLKFIT